MLITIGEFWLGTYEVKIHCEVGLSVNQQKGKIILWEWDFGEAPNLFHPPPLTSGVIVYS